MTRRRRRLWGVACAIAVSALLPYVHARAAADPGQSNAAASASPPAVDDHTSARTAFAASLAWRTDRIIADQTHYLQSWLAATTPIAYVSQGALRLTIALQTTAGDPQVVKRLTEIAIFGGNLAERPFPVSIDLRGIPDGDYQYVADVREDEVVLRTFATPVKLVAGLDARQADAEARLARIEGHDSAKASIRYPFDLARVINVGKRVFGSGSNNPEFGLSQSGQPSLYDFPAGLKRSAALLAALEGGRDLVWRAGGETVRHYYMSEADEILPYRVFVPASWNGKASLPLVFILHGNSRDQDFYFERDGRIIPRTAETHGYMVVAPLGYSPNGGYNYVPYGRENAAGARGTAGARAAPQTFGPAESVPGARGARAAGGGFGGVNGSVTPALVRSEWSEQDAMHVFDLVRAEYPVDARRTYLFGYSAGGQGAHYIGPKFAEHWAAIAVGGSNAQPGVTYPFARVRNIPLMIFYGAGDTPNVGPSRAMAQALEQNGVEVVVKAYDGANHDTAPSAAIADIFAFFDRHIRK